MPIGSRLGMTIDLVLCFELIKEPYRSHGTRLPRRMIPALMK